MESYASKWSVCRKSKEDEKARETLEATTKFDGEKYEVGLLWKNSKPQLPINYSSAVSQMKSLECRLETDPQLKKRNQETIEVDVEKWFVRIFDVVKLENTKTDR